MRIANPAQVRTPPGTKAGSLPLPSPTLPRKFADVDWGSRKRNTNKICAECWPGAAFGPYWLLTERLCYETIPLLPALRDLVRVHGRRDDGHAAIAETMQPRATAGQQAQTDTASSDTAKAEDGTNTKAAADTVEDGTATSTGTSAINTESTDGTAAPSLRTQTNPTPEAISTTSQTGYAHSATAGQNGVTFTVSWNDAPAGTATTFHVTQLNGSSQAKARMDVPTYWDGGSQESDMLGRFALIQRSIHLYAGKKTNGAIS